MARIIVVEDEDDLRDDLVEYLNRCGFRTSGAVSGATLDAQLREEQADLIILDVNLPDEDGFAVAQRVRAGSKVAIIMLTARSGLIDRVIGLELGADVYLVKPVDFREVEAQVKALMRRMQRTAELTPTPPVHGATLVPPMADAKKIWLFDEVEWRIQAPGSVAVALTGTEYKFLSLLVAVPGEPVTRQVIAFALTGRDWDPYSRSIDSLVRRLRIKVEESTGQALPVQSVHGVGYAFVGAVAMATTSNGTE